MCHRNDGQELQRKPLIQGQGFNRTELKLALKYPLKDKTGCYRNNIPETA